MRRIAAAVLALLAPLVDANEVHRQLAALTEEQRQGVLARLLTREGERCPAVTRTFHQGMSKDGASFWSVSCSSEKDWQITFGPAPANVRFLDCSTVKRVNGAGCFQKWK
jgi:hypothetical protein